MNGAWGTGRKHWPDRWIPKGEAWPCCEGGAPQGEQVRTAERANSVPCPPLCSLWSILGPPFMWTPQIRREADLS